MFIDSGCSVALISGKRLVRNIPVKTQLVSERMNYCPEIKGEKEREREGTTRAKMWKRW